MWPLARQMMLPKVSQWALNAVRQTVARKGGYAGAQTVARKPLYVVPQTAWWKA